MPFPEHLARLDAVYRAARLAGAPTLPALPTARDRLLALQRRASRRQEESAAAREAFDRLQAEATAVVEARDVELQRLYDADVAFRSRRGGWARSQALPTPWAGVDPFPLSPEGLREDHSSGRELRDPDVDRPRGKAVPLLGRDSSREVLSTKRPAAGAPSTRVVSSTSARPRASTRGGPEGEPPEGAGVPLEAGGRRRPGAALAPPAGSGARSTAPRIRGSSRENGPRSEPCSVLRGERRARRGRAAPRVPPSRGGRTSRCPRSRADSARRGDRRDPTPGAARRRARRRDRGRKTSRSPPIGVWPARATPGGVVRESAGAISPGSSPARWPGVGSQSGGRSHRPSSSHVKRGPAAPASCRSSAARSGGRKPGKKRGRGWREAGRRPRPPRLRGRALPRSRRSSRGEGSGRRRSFRGGRAPGRPRCCRR